LGGAACGVITGRGRSMLSPIALYTTCECVTDASCDDAFQVDSSCYKVHKNERVNWFTAVNRCLSNNASLAVFDDDVRQYFPNTLLTYLAWIGLVKSWWTWPGLGQLTMICFNFISSLPVVVQRIAMSIKNKCHVQVCLHVCPFACLN